MKHSIENPEELNKLYKRASVILHFLIKKTTNKNLMTPFLDALEAAYKRSDLRGLRMVNRDLSSWSKALSSTDLTDLKNILNKEMNESDNIHIAEKRTIDILKIVINKRKIENEEEYTIIDDYVKDLSEGDLFFPDQATFHDLLLNFEKRK